MQLFRLFLDVYIRLSKLPDKNIFRTKDVHIMSSLLFNSFKEEEKYDKLHVFEI